MTDLAWVMPGLGWFLWTLGGWKWKWVRRFLWPICIGIMAYLYKTPLSLCIATTIAMSIALCLGYGTNYSWRKRTIVGASYGLTLGFLGFHWFIIAIPIVFIGCYLLSLKYHWFTWKIVEGLTGMAQGIYVALVLL